MGRGREEYRGGERGDTGEERGYRGWEGGYR